MAPTYWSASLWGLVVGAGLGTLAVGIRDLLAGDALSLNPGPDPA